MASDDFAQFLSSQLSGLEANILNRVAALQRESLLFHGGGNRLAIPTGRAETCESVSTRDRGPGSTRSSARLSSFPDAASSVSQAGFVPWGATPHGSSICSQAELAFQASSICSQAELVFQGSSVCISAELADAQASQASGGQHELDEELPSPMPRVWRHQSEAIHAAPWPGGSAGSRHSAEIDSGEAMPKHGGLQLQTSTSSFFGKGGVLGSSCSSFFNSFDGSGAEVPPSLEVQQSDRVGNDAIAAYDRGVVRGKMVYAGGIANSELGPLQGIISTARSGKATQSVVDNRVFMEKVKATMGEWTIALAIILNAAVLGISLEVNKESGWWIAVDAMFALFFFAEMILKMRSLGVLGYFLTDRGVFNARDRELRWRLFEFALVATALFEVGVAMSSGGSKFALFRMLRLARITRIIRVCRLSCFADLMMMINGAIGGARALLWSMVLISIPLYAIAVFLREALGDYRAAGDLHDVDLFSSLGQSFFTIFRCIVSGECTTVEGKPIFVLVMKEYGWEYGALYCIIVLSMNVGLFNVIAALYVENTVAAAKFNNVHQKRQRLLDEHWFADKTKQLVEFIWKVHMSYCPESPTSARFGSSSRLSIHSDDAGELMSIQITPRFFNHMRTFREFQELLIDLDVSDEDQLDLFETLDVDGGGTIDLEELIVGICKLRGDARRSDIVGVSLIARAMQVTLTRFEENAMRVLENQARALKVFEDGILPHVPKLVEDRKLRRTGGQTPSQHSGCEGGASGDETEGFERPSAIHARGTSQIRGEGIGLSSAGSVAWADEDSASEVSQVIPESVIAAVAAAMSVPNGTELTPEGQL